MMLSCCVFGSESKVQCCKEQYCIGTCNVRSMYQGKLDMVQSQKWQNDLSLFPRETMQHYSNPSLCPNDKCQWKWSWTVLWRRTRPSKTNTKKHVLFIVGGYNAKVGSQEISTIMGKFGLGVQNEAWQRLIEFGQENALVIANTLSQ